MEINELQGLLGIKDAERFLKLYEPGVTEEERRELCRKILNNRLAKMRRDMSQYLMAFNQVMHEKSSIRKCLDMNPRQEALEKMFWLLDEQEHNYKETFTIYGRMITMLLPHYESIATDHDFAQILNANMREVERCREDYMKRVAEGKRKSDDSFFTALIFIYKIEPDDNCPFMEAMW